jgi:membrane protein required for colicin V production
MLTLFDYAVFAIIGLSVLVGVMRGAVRELLALASWMTAFLVVKFYAVPLAGHLPAALGAAPLRLLAAFILLFLATLLIMGLISLAVAGLFKLVGLGFLDRGMGVLFGLGRGVFIVMLLVLAGGLTALPREPFWRNAMLSPPLEAFALYLKFWLPSDFARHIRYE